MACCATTPRHYLDQCWHIVNCTLKNNPQCLNANTIISFTTLHLKKSSAKRRALIYQHLCLEIAIQNLNTSLRHTYHFCIDFKRETRVGTSNYTPQILWDVFTCPCPWYLLLTHNSSIICLASSCASYLIWIYFLTAPPPPPNKKKRKKKKKIKNQTFDGF